MQARSRCSPLEGGSSLQAPFDSCDVTFRNYHVEVDELEDEATPQFTPVATSESSLLLGEIRCRPACPRMFKAFTFERRQ